MKRIIDRSPPSPTGDAKRDIEAMNDYLFYLQETLNMILRSIGE